MLAGRRLLVVEDEMLVLMNTEDMLADLGCRSVTAAATVDHALALIKGQSFDAAMLDMNLSGDKTHQVADALAERGVPFFFATGYVGHDGSNSHNDQLVLEKPYQPHQLADILAIILCIDPIPA